MTAKTKYQIAFILDSRISHDKMGVLTQLVHSLKNQFSIDVIQGNELTEDQLLEKTQKEEYPLILAPLHSYQIWNRIEGHFGMNRTSGPTFAGYFCEALPSYSLAQPSGQFRRIIFDFYHLSPQELAPLIRSLLNDHERSGLKPLLAPHTLIYCETWYGHQGQGNRIDHVLGLSEITQTTWSKRSSAIQILLSSFWSLVYEEGPGKAKSIQTHSSSTPKAYFQIGADARCLFMRLYYLTLPHCSPKEALKNFWPNQTSPTRPGQLLLKYGDFLRVHTIPETSEIEIVAGLMESAPAEKAAGHTHTLWIEPLAARLIADPPHEAPGPNSPHLRVLPSISQVKLRAVANQPTSEVFSSTASRVLLEATSKIKELKDKLAEKSETIRELKSGGIGTAGPLPPPDVESLLEAFQQKYFDARYQIRQFELQLLDLENRGGSSQQLEELRLKMEALTNREKTWIKKILSTLETFKEAKKNKP